MFLTRFYSRQIVCIFGAGALSVLAFAPFDYAPIILVSIATLIFHWRSATPSQAFFQGLVFGLGLYLFGTSWVYNSLAVYGGMPLWMGSIAVLGFSLLMALFIGLCGFSLARISPLKSSMRLLMVAPMWVIFEWAKSWVLTGFPWLDLGYTQTSTMLFELAPIGGVYLITFVLVALGATVVYFVSAYKSATSFRSWVRASAPLLITVFVSVSIALFSAQQPWGRDVGEPVRVGIVQPNTPIEQKWGMAYRDKVITGLVQRNNELLDAGSLDLIVWPETALPVLLSQTSDEFWSAVRPTDTALLTGLVERRFDEHGVARDYNAAVLHCGDQMSVYRKRHLVPFGEYLPMKFLFQWVIDYLQLPMSDFSSWQETQSLECGDSLKLGLSICYEDAFSGDHRDHTHDATILINISEDAWFGDSLAPHQRLQMAQMRAKELALPLVRSANTGPSVLVDHTGKLMVVSEQFVPAVLSGQIQPRTGETWFRHYGEWVIYLSILLLIVGLLVQRLSSSSLIRSQSDRQKG